MESACVLVGVGLAAAARSPLIAMVAVFAAAAISVTATLARSQHRGAAPRNRYSSRPAGDVTGRPPGGGEAPDG
jgi:hypothetical protein